MAWPCCHQGVIPALNSIQRVWPSQCVWSSRLLIVLATCTVNSATAQPVIISQPLSAEVSAGLSTYFSLVADGTPPVTYQWQKDGKDIANATSSMLYIPVTMASHAGSYVSRVTDGNGTVTSQAATLTVYQAHDFDLNNWLRQNPSPTENSLVAVAWSGSQYVAVGEAGKILTSPDGANWTVSNVVSDLLDVTWGGDRFVAVGEHGTILTSPDGTAWTSQNSSWDYYLCGVSWSGDQFVAVGPGVVLTSPDGVNWANFNSGSEYNLYGVTWSGSQFVAVGWPSLILTSPDGVTWTNQSSSTTNVLSKVAWNGNLFVVVGYQGTILTSRDGISWSTRNSGTQDYLEDVVWGANRFVVVGASGTILTSPDGISWSRRPSGVDDYLTGVSWDGSRFMVTGANGTILTSAMLTAENPGTAVMATPPLGGNFTNWQVANFTPEELTNDSISGPNAVLGPDGIPNLVKYALGLDAKSDAVAGLPSLSTDGTTWTYTFTCPENLTDVLYAVQCSTDMTNWFSAGITMTLISSVNGTNTWQATYSVGSAPNAFFRLQVSLP